MFGNRKRIIKLERKLHNLEEVVSILVKKDLDNILDNMLKDFSKMGSKHPKKSPKTTKKGKK